MSGDPIETAQAAHAEFDGRPVLSEEPWFAGSVLVVSLLLGVLLLNQLYY